MSQASKQQEKTFTGKVGFVLASVGAAIGLGAIWKFPYMAGAEGGAAFLLPYIIFSFTLAFGLLLTEITLGKAGKGGIVTAYRNLGGSFWSVLGYLGIIIGFVVLSFYSVVGGWCLLYFFEFFFTFLISSGSPPPTRKPSAHCSEACLPRPGLPFPLRSASLP